jgi:hypothetical protein
MEDAKFNIVKKTVEFLSTDTSTFKNVKSNTCASCRTFDDLKKFSESNKLTNAGKNVIDPLSEWKLDTSKRKWKESLQRFKQQAHDRITGYGKDRRKLLKGYNEYLTSINRLVNEVVPDGETGAPLSGVSGTTSNETLNSGSDSTGNNNAALPGQAKSSLSSQWIPYGIIAILIGLAGYLGYKLYEEKNKSKMYENDINKLKQQSYDDKEKIITVTNKNDQLEKDLKTLRQKNKSLEEYARLAESKKNGPMSPQTTEAEPHSEQVAPTRAFVQKPKVAAIITKFAKYADMVDGFSNAELLDSPDDETIFQISIVAPNIGEYKIIDNPRAQKYALMNVQYFLGKTCKYDTFPMDRTTIQTDSPGTVKLNGVKWAITTPAKISFI